MPVKSTGGVPKISRLPPKVQPAEVYYFKEVWYVGHILLPEGITTDQDMLNII
jgi:hypothetical protein